MTGSAAFRVLSRFVETMLTMIETCRQQRRNAFAFITAAVEARLAHKPAPLHCFPGCEQLPFALTNWYYSSNVRTLMSQFLSVNVNIAGQVSNFAASRQSIILLKWIYDEV
jgi:hypothetical protein